MSENEVRREVVSDAEVELYAAYSVDDLLQRRELLGKSLSLKKHDD